MPPENDPTIRLPVLPIMPLLPDPVCGLSETAEMAKTTGFLSTVRSLRCPERRQFQTAANVPAFPPPPHIW